MTVFIGDLKKLHSWLKDLLLNDLKKYLNSNNIKVNVSVYDYKTIITIRYNSNIDTLKISRLLNFNKSNDIFVYYNNNDKNIKYDIIYNSICIGILNNNLMANIGLLHGLLNNSDIKAISFNDNEKRLLKNLKNNDNEKTISYKDLSLLEKNIEKINKKAIRLKVTYPKKFNRYVINNYLNKANLYLSNNDNNKSKKDKIFTTFIKDLLKTEKIIEKNKQKNNNYGIYDNKRYEKKDTLKDYDNFNYYNYYNLKDLKFKNLNYKL